MKQTSDFDGKTRIDEKCNLLMCVHHWIIRLTLLIPWIICDSFDICYCLTVFQHFEWKNMEFVKSPRQ